MNDELIDHIGQTAAEYIAGQLALRGVMDYDARHIALIFASATLRLGAGSAEFFEAVKNNIGGMTFTPHGAPVEAVDGADHTSAAN